MHRIKTIRTLSRLGARIRLRYYGTEGLRRWWVGQHR